MEGGKIAVYLLFFLITGAMIFGTIYNIKKAKEL
jgi:hypothetical protein